MAATQDWRAGRDSVLVPTVVPLVHRLPGRHWFEKFPCYFAVLAVIARLTCAETVPFDQVSKTEAAQGKSRIFGTMFG